VTGFGGRRSIETFGGLDFDETNWGLRAGVAKNWFGLGNTVIYGEYNQFDNVNNLDAESEIAGVSIIQNIDAAALELFLSYKHYSLDVVGAEDMDIVFSGARIKF
jgi:hypothetical protein